MLLPLLQNNLLDADAPQNVVSDVQAWQWTTYDSAVVGFVNVAVVSDFVSWEFTTYDSTIELIPLEQDVVSDFATWRWQTYGSVVTPAAEATGSGGPDPTDLGSHQHSPNRFKIVRMVIEEFLNRAA